MNTIYDLLDRLGVRYSSLDSGEIFVRRRDGWSMYLRPLPNGKYDWSSNGSGNDTNHMEFRAPQPLSEDDAITAVREFLQATK